MTPPSLIVDGVNVQLGKRIGRGGEGEVFALENDLDRALKVYTATDNHQQEAKIASIVNRKIAQQSNLVAFPLAIARHSDGRFAGFVMKRVNGHKPLFELYSPGARKKHFPRADFRFLVRTAANVCRAVASVHKTGCVIGDINHSGILISDEAKVALIDADSFQFIDGVNKFLCRVGVPEYTPPELQGKKLSGVIRTANHDAFGLAVVIFQLLFMGRHPFVGAFAKGDMPMERAIFENRFVYSLKRDVGMTRPPGAASLADFPRDIAEAFEQAFSPNAERRPNAEVWINILVKLESSVVQCSSDGLHYYPQEAAECPWCRMENKLGMLLFLPTFSNRAVSDYDPGASSFKLAVAWAAIEQVVLPDPKQLQPAVPSFEYTPSELAKRAKHKVLKSKAIGIAVLVLAAVLCICRPGFWFVWAALACFGFYKFAISFLKIESEKLLVDKYFRSKEQLEEAIEVWRTRCGITQAMALKASLNEARVQFINLEREKQLRMSLYGPTREASQLVKYLEGHEIRKAKIRNIGLARQTALASYGIETALDITEAKVLEVAGFGLNNMIPLIEWRKSLEKAFVYDPKTNDMDIQELQKVTFEVDQKGSHLRKALASGATDLAHAVHAIDIREKKEDPIIARAYFEFKRDREDLKYLKIRIPRKRPNEKTGLNSGSASTQSYAVQTQNQSVQTQNHAGQIQHYATQTQNYAAPTGFQAKATTQNRYARPSSSSSQSSSALNSSTLTASSQSTSASSVTSVTCPKCGSSMVKRIMRKGSRAGQMFYGCSTYPGCNGIRTI
jgi:DNA-binding helix-hairpin-helix protein with protein kinase domain